MAIGLCSMGVIRPEGIASHVLPLEAVYIMPGQQDSVFGKVEQAQLDILGSMLHRGTMQNAGVVALSVENI